MSSIRVTQRVQHRKAFKQLRRSCFRPLQYIQEIAISSKRSQLHAHHSTPLITHPSVTQVQFMDLLRAAGVLGAGYWAQSYLWRVLAPAARRCAGKQLVPTARQVHRAVAPAASKSAAGVQNKPALGLLADARAVHKRRTRWSGVRSIARFCHWWRLGQGVCEHSGRVPPERPASRQATDSAPRRAATKNGALVPYRRVFSILSWRDCRCHSQARGRRATHITV